MQCFFVLPKPCCKLTKIYGSFRSLLRGNWELIYYFIVFLPTEPLWLRSKVYPVPESYQSCDVVVVVVFLFRLARLSVELLLHNCCSKPVDVFVDLFSRLSILILLCFLGVTLSWEPFPSTWRPKKAFKQALILFAMESEWHVLTCCSFPIKEARHFAVPMFCTPSPLPHFRLSLHKSLVTRLWSIGIPCGMTVCIKICCLE